MVAFLGIKVSFSGTYGVTFRRMVSKIGAMVSFSGE